MNSCMCFALHYINLPLLFYLLLLFYFVHTYMYRKLIYFTCHTMTTTTQAFCIVWPTNNSNFFCCIFYILLLCYLMLHCMDFTTILNNNINIYINLLNKEIVAIFFRLSYYCYCGAEHKGTCKSFYYLSLIVYKK